MVFGGEPAMIHEQVPGVRQGASTPRLTGPGPYREMG